MTDVCGHRARPPRALPLRGGNRRRRGRPQRRGEPRGRSRHPAPPIAGKGAVQPRRREHEAGGGGGKPLHPRLRHSSCTRGLLWKSSMGPDRDDRSHPLQGVCEHPPEHGRSRLGVGGVDAFCLAPTLALELIRGCLSSTSKREPHSGAARSPGQGPLGISFHHGRSRLMFEGGVMPPMPKRKIRHPWPHCSSKFVPLQRISGRFPATPRTDLR